MDLWQLVAREEIRDLVARYNALGDSGRIDELLSLFTQDALLEVRDSGTYRGSREIRELFATAATPTPGDELVRIRHHTSTLVIDLEDESCAAGRCYFVVLTDRGPDHWGRYRDVYRRVADRWLFEARSVTVEGAVAGGWGEERLGRKLP